jgi:hypothetical protein
VQVVDTLAPPLVLIAGLPPTSDIGGVITITGNTVTWDGFSLSNGETGHLDIPVQAAPTALPCTSNTASIAVAPGTPGTDGNGANNSATVGIGLPACADLVIERSTIDDHLFWSIPGVRLNIRIFHRVTVRNLGPQAATNVNVHTNRYDMVPPDIIFLTGPGGNTLATLAPGATAELIGRDYDVTSAGADLAVSFEMEVHADEDDPDRANNVDTGNYPIIRSRRGSGIFCFVATAAYGSYLEPEVVVLRRFRDRVLMKFAPGRAFVDWYYRVSPPIAAWIAERGWARALARAALTPIVYTIKYPLPAGLLWFALFALPWWAKRGREPS